MSEDSINHDMPTEITMIWGGGAKALQQVMKSDTASAAKLFFTIILMSVIQFDHNCDKTGKLGQRVCQEPQFE